jgi:hypothetical protein
MPAGTLRAMVFSSALIGHAEEYGPLHTRRCFRTYAHSSDVVEAVVPRYGLPQIFHARAFLWQVVTDAHRESI